MKKFSVIVVSILMFLISAIFAQAEGVRLKTNLDFGYSSHFVGGLSGFTIYDHSVFQQSITLTDNPSGLYLKLWSSYSPRGGINSDFGDEVDYIIGIYKTLHGIGFDVGYVFYNLYDMKNTKGDLHAVYLTVDLPEIRKIKLYISVENDIPTDKEVLEGGFVYKVSAKYNFNLPKSLNNQVLNFNLSVGGHDGVYGMKPEKLSFARLDIITTFKIWKFEVTPGINFQKSFNGSNGRGIAEDKIWYSINFSVPLF